MWFTSAVEFYRPAVSINVSPRISSSPVLATRCLFAISNYFPMWRAPNKTKSFGNASSWHFHWITLLRACFGWPQQSNTFSCWGFKLFVYSIQSFIRWCCMSSVCTISFNNGKMELFEDVIVDTRFFRHDTSSMRVYQYFQLTENFPFIWNAQFDDLLFHSG